MKIKTLILCLITSIQLSAKENYLAKCNLKLIDIIMEDVFTPPVASRIHAYSNIAAYEVLAQNGVTLKPFAGRLTDMPTIPKATLKINLDIAAEIAFLETGKKLVYSEHLVNAFVEQEKANWQLAGIDTILINRSMAYGMQVASILFDWTKKDNYSYTRTLMRYQLSDSSGAWQPTAPEYANGLEPNWHLMRSFIETKPLYESIAPNMAYSEKKNSAYHKSGMALYKSTQTMDSFKINTALFWDDNPKTAVSKGHLNYFIHKATPGGHWLKIASQAIIAKNLNAEKTAEVFAMSSIAMYEAFLNCWTQKYVSNSVRPETYLQRIKDPKFRPLIETPPFPEYPSGHSTVSAAIATVLTKYISQPYAFTDSSQLYIGMPPRHFKSFMDAADQASISRFYGGIHYMHALTNGQKHGVKIANHIIRKLQ